MLHVMTNPTHDLQVDPEATRLEAFLTATREVLAALAEGSVIDSTVRVMVPRDHAWQDVRPEEVAGPFLAHVDFAARGVVGRFVFGDRESAMSLLVAPARLPSLRYHLGEWVVAFGSQPAPESTFDWVLTTRRVHEAVARYGTLLLSHAERIADAKSESFAQMDAVRAIRFETHVAYWRARDQERDEYAAAAAFRAGDWARVIEILSAHESQLSAAQAMKLTLARKRAGGLQGS
jgi:hypothetical protein